MQRRELHCSEGTLAHRQGKDCTFEGGQIFHHVMGRPGTRASGHGALSRPWRSLWVRLHTAPCNGESCASAGADSDPLLQSADTAPGAAPPASVALL